MPNSFTNSYFRSPLGQVARQGIGTVGRLGNIGALKQGALAGIGGAAVAQKPEAQSTTQTAGGGFIQDFLTKYQNDQAYRGRMDALFGQPFASYITPRFTEQYGVSAENLTFQQPTQEIAQRTFSTQHGLINDSGQKDTPKLINDPGQKDTPLPKISTPKPPSTPSSLPSPSIYDPGFNYDTGRAYTPFQISRGITGTGGGAGGGK